MNKDNIKIVIFVSIAFVTFLIASHRVNYNIQNEEISDHIYRELSKSSYPECLAKIPKDKVLNKYKKEYIRMRSN